MTPTQLSGLDAVAAMFEHAKHENRAAFLPYYPIGYPDYEKSLDIITAMAEVGVDGFEIGIPFSDPLADGPTIQYASQVALEQGITVQMVLEGVRTLRERGVKQPMFMFSYLNPLIAYGSAQFVRDARSAGADGLIVPDLPPEEPGFFADACVEENMAQVFFLAPTSNTQRITIAAQAATGFIYVVSVTGITGARTELPPDLKAFIERVRTNTEKPLVLGFGISTPQQAHSMNGLVDGFIVGSALVKAGKDGVQPARDLAAQLRIALDT